MKFRKKPVVVNAYRFLGDYLEASQWEIEVNIYNRPQSLFAILGEGLKIYTLEDDEISVSKGDWIIQDINGDFYPCKHEVFKRTYERVENE